MAIARCGTCDGGSQRVTPLSYGSESCKKPGKQYRYRRNNGRAFLNAATMRSLSFVFIRNPKQRKMLYDDAFHVSLSDIDAYLPIDRLQSGGTRDDGDGG